MGVTKQEAEEWLGMGEGESLPDDVWLAFCQLYPRDTVASEREETSND